MLEQRVQSIEVVLSCSNLSDSVRFLTRQLGFKVRMIMPAEAPTVAVLSSADCVLRLEQTEACMKQGPPAKLRLLCDLELLPPGMPMQFEGPDGMIVQLAAVRPALVVPPGTQEFVFTRRGEVGDWHEGRAGMLYRDLIPSRLGGRFVASHILIPMGGPVADYVHYHRVRLQIIFCKKGWVRVAYEDQGDPITMNAGDCVLQPPEIRHRVLEASEGLEVIEIGCPAVHETWGDPSMTLPTGRNLPERVYDGQRFVSHVASEATWEVSRLPGFECRDTGIGKATDGLAGVRVLRSHKGPALAGCSSAGGRNAHAGELAFYLVLSGTTVFESTVLGTHELNPGDSWVLPARADCRIRPAEDLELLEVTLPAELPSA